MGFSLQAVKSNPGDFPLTACLTLESGKVLTVPCRAAELSTFARFRNAVADRHGIWLVWPFRHPAAWHGTVAEAFRWRASE